MSALPSMLYRFLLFIALVCTGLTAQTVRWEPNSGSIAFGQTSDLNLVFEQCEPSGEVTLPAIPGLQVGGQPNRSDSTSFTMVNGRASRTRTLVLGYRAQPTERRTIQIPEFTVETDKGKITVAPASFQVGDATVGQTSISLDSIVRSVFITPTKEVWAGEVFPLTYSLNAVRRYLHQLGSDPEWTAAPLIAEPFAKPEQVDSTTNNEERVSLVYKTRAYAKAPGVVPLKSATQLVNITTGSTSFGIFARASLEQYSVTSQPASITVKPLPTPAPSGFLGAVGKFKLNANVVPTTPTVGEPVTWTLTLEGTGNWPDITGVPSRSVSKDFTLITPQAKRANKDGSLFEASITEDVVLIPTRAGSYTLGPVTLVTFNPGTGAYETLTTKAVTITVAPGATPSPSANAPTTGENSTTRPSDTGSSTPAISSKPSAPEAAIPRDPLPAAPAATAPLSQTLLLIAALSALLVPLTAWIVLALRRAGVTDPGRPLREAHIRLANTVREIAALEASGEQVSARLTALLQRWQRDTAILFRLQQAVPTPAAFSDATWATLWSEADRALYAGTPLAAGWAARAAQALNQHRAPGFSVFQLFLSRNLVPLLALAGLIAAALPASALAAEAAPTDPVVAYNRGDFASASATWSETLRKEPTAWTAHHNLALTLIQQDRAGEAAAHALAAFVQQPRDPSVRWHLAYAFKTAGVAPAELRPFLTESPAGSVARLASPFEWQAILIGASWLAALGLALSLASAYRGRRARTPLALLIVSVLLAAIAGASLHTYGPLKEKDAVVIAVATTLRSIPTDLDTPQKTTPVAVGVIAKTDKTFLGWTRLVFTDGQTGWARTESIVPLWQKPATASASSR